jgi:arylsulfatase A-like enzyme
MRILYIDIDSLRPDHLGCYGYHRNTSPNIDAVAKSSVRFDNLYISDGPCLPSRTALWSGRCGFHTGVVNHGGAASIPFPEGIQRGHRDVFGKTSWMVALRQAGFHTATISSFADRHSAWHWLAGYNEIHSPLRRGLERADDVSPIASDWIKRNARRDKWFLHLNFWDPHTPYRTPLEYGNPFQDEEIPIWLTEDVRQKLWEGYGPHSAQEPHEWGDETFIYDYPRLPIQLDSMENVKQWIDGYDVSIRYADDHIGYILNALADEGVLDETVIMISADHAENQGELNIWGDHHTADHITARVPLIVRWPGITDPARRDAALHYHYDWAATLLELVGATVPDNWDAIPFTAAFSEKRDTGRNFLVLSNQTWTCQRSVRFGDYICLRTYHDGYKALEPVMLFNVKDDPHEQHDLAPQQPDVVNQAMGMLAEWHHCMVLTSASDIDPMMTVLREGGPFYTRGQLPKYLKRLRETGRAQHAEKLAARHPHEI